MKLLPQRLNDKPQYVFHPLRLARRLGYRPPSGIAQREVVDLSWGLPLEVYSREAIGHSIRTTGIFDPCVSETLYRLVDPGELVVDVGANVGYLSSLAAVRAGASGEVWAFEPHPQVLEALVANVERWSTTPAAPVRIFDHALSDRDGTAELRVGEHFHANMGLASLEEDGEPSSQSVSVRLRQLDDVVGDRTVGLLKVDVEGHEPEVLRGARRLMESGRVRDIIFEDHHPYPDESTELVEAAGYRLFALSNDLLGPELGPAEGRSMNPWPGPSYLATRDPDRAVERLRRRRWTIKGIGPGLPRRATLGR